MNDQPVVSVVTIVRNDREGLARTVASVHQQTFSNLEHLVIDGASTDGTTAWLMANQSLVRGPVLSEPDDGVYDAMNKGLDRATGVLTVFMNAGDVFPDERTVALVAEDWAKRHWAWAYGGVRWVRASAPIADIRQEPFDLRSFALGRMWVPHQSTYVTTDLMRALGGFRPEFGVGADQDLLLRVAMKSVPRVFSEILSEFDVGGLHSNQTMWEREFAWRRIRLATYGPVRPDLLRTTVKGSYLTVRHYLGEQIRARAKGRFPRLTRASRPRTS